MFREPDQSEMRSITPRQQIDITSINIPGGKLILTLFMACILFVILVYVLMPFTYVGPNQYGIKETKIGATRGIQTTLYEAGYAFVMPFGFEKMHLFPRNMLVLELTFDEEKTGAKDNPFHTFDKAAKIQTSDGFFVDVDVTILYRISDPYKLITHIGPGNLYLTNGILPKAEPILKQTFGELTTEDFYNSPLRMEKGQKALEQLNAELESKGLKVEHVMTRYFRYNDEIQKNIEAKKLQDQLVFKNQAEGKAATEAAKLQKVSQEGEMHVKVTIQEGEAYKTKKDAEGEYYTRSKEAEADLLVKTAEAKAIEMKNNAMQEIGSERKVAMEMVKVLEGLECVIIPSGGENGLNPLDLQRIIQLFGVNSTVPATPVPPAPVVPEAPKAPPAPAVPVTPPAVTSEPVPAN